MGWPWILAIVVAGVLVFAGIVTLGVLADDDDRTDVDDAAPEEIPEEVPLPFTIPEPDADGVTGEADEIDDVTLTDCRRGPFGDMLAVLEITNDSSDRSDYSIDVVFENPSGSRQLGTGFAFVTGLANGQSRTEEISSLEDAPRNGRFECHLTSVQRTASL